MSVKFFRNKTNNFSKGFSLVELLVVCAIFVTLTGVVLFNQNRFSSDMSIQNLAYQIALTIRQAQIYGISVKGSKINSSFDIAYGIHFTSSNNSFVLFSDENQNKIFDAGDITISTFKLQNGNTIKSVCDTPSGQCASANYVDITFKRPNPEANIYDPSNIQQQTTTIIVQSALKDKTKSIIVNQTGQIYVQ